MNDLDGRVRLTLPPPEDRMRVDRLRAALRRVWSGARAAALVATHPLRRRRSPPGPGVARILVVCGPRLGEMAIAASTLHELHDHFASAEITLLAPAAPLSLLKSHPAVARRVPLRDRRCPPALVGRFDLAIDLTLDGALAAARLVARSRAPLRAGFPGGGRQVHFNLPSPRPAADRHLADLHRDLLETLGVTGPRRPPAPALYVTAEERGEALARFAALGAAEPRVVVHPGAGCDAKRWPPERFAEVIARLTERTGAACIVLSGPGEESLRERVCAATPDALASEGQSIRGMMAMMAASDLFIGNTSGPLHIAAALGMATVSVAGPTSPLRFAPRGPSDRVVRHPVPCSPCERWRCWHHTCLRAIDPEQVLAEAGTILEDYLPRRQAR